MRFLVRVLNFLVLLLAVVYGLLIVTVVTLQEPLTNTEVEQAAPRPQVNPIEWMLSRLPLSPFFRRDIPMVVVMIENQEHARPHQQGLDKALLVEEWPVEGFITRFAAVFDGNNLPEEAGPVRSIRPYFLHALAPWPALLLHAGGSPEAFNVAAGSESVVAINGIGGTYFEFFHRKDGIPAPHDLFTTKEDIENILLEHALPAMQWPPYATGIASKGEAATRIAVNFYNPQHDTSYLYDSRTQRYARTNGEVENQAFPANVLFLEIPVTGVGEFGRLSIPIDETGPLLLFRNGMVVRGTWQKTDDTEPFAFLAEDGNPLKFARGQTWISVVPSFDRVTWSSEAEEQE